MSLTSIDARDRELLERQALLQQEAEEVRRDLHLDRLLRRAGNPVPVGSAALGLMVWRDLDVTVICEELDIDQVLEIAKGLAPNPRVRDVRFRNDTGKWNQDAFYPDGLYLGLNYGEAGGELWKIDTWFVTDAERQPDLQHLTAFAPRITEEARLAILRIKTVWHRRPEYGSTVTSFDIYKAVLDGGIRSVEGFEELMNDHGRERETNRP